jgi:hypothetical protein
MVVASCRWLVELAGWVDGKGLHDEVFAVLVLVGMVEEITITAVSSSGLLIATPLVQ